MDDFTNYTPFSDDNILGLTDKNITNEYEAKGLAAAEIYVFELAIEENISKALLWRFIKLLSDNGLPQTNWRGVKVKSLAKEPKEDKRKNH